MYSNMVSKTYLLAKGIRLAFLFVRNAVGSVQTPYETYRKLAKGDDLFQAIPLFLICISYFGWSSLVRFGLSSHPYQLSFSFGKLVIAASVTYILILFSLVFIARLVEGSGSYRSVFLPWTYSLLPTVLWFFTTSVMTLIFPPPRTESFLGLLFSFLFLSLSLFLFFWKGMLYYLTLRFGMKLDMGKIMIASLILLPLGALHAVVMYYLGIFKIPFI